MSTDAGSLRLQRETYQHFFWHSVVRLLTTDNDCHINLSSMPDIVIQTEVNGQELTPPLETILNADAQTPPLRGVPTGNCGHRAHGQGDNEEDGAYFDRCLSLAQTIEAATEMCGSKTEVLCRVAHILLYDLDCEEEKAEMELQQQQSHEAVH
jgi:hypothetical protein